MHQIVKRIKKNMILQTIYNEKKLKVKLLKIIEKKKKSINSLNKNPRKRKVSKKQILN